MSEQSKKRSEERAKGARAPLRASAGARFLGAALGLGGGASPWPTAEALLIRRFAWDRLAGLGAMLAISFALWWVVVHAVRAVLGLMQ